uniref:Uncharacterized protein n=1 Tax=Rhizophora mucronata TaxID=61149 RepID=A0A2P2J2Z9_RHIMU
MDLFQLSTALGD